MRPARLWCRRYLPDLVALLVVAIWGTGFSFMKFALDQFNVPTFMVLRYLGMLAVSWGVLVWRHRRTGEPFMVVRSDFPRLALAGLLGYSFYIPLSTVGLSATTAFSNALLIATAPLFMILLASLLRIETIGRRQYAGMAIALAGILVFVLPAVRAGAGPTGRGDLISLAAAVFFAGYSVTSRSLLSRYPLAALMAYTLAIGTVPIILLLLPWVSIQEWNRITPAGWTAFAWTVVVPVYVAWTLWNWVMARVGIARASLFMYLVPIIGGIASWILLGEGFGPLKIAGGALTLVGLGFARRSAAPQRGALGAPAAPGPAQVLAVLRPTFRKFGRRTS